MFALILLRPRPLAGVSVPFGFFDKDDKAAKERRDASLEALQRGEITPTARRRLNDLHKSGDKFFTATLSGGAMLLSKQAGYRAITQVMGSAFVKLDFEEYKESYCGYSREVVPLTQRHGQVRQIALSRLMQEASLLGADGVVGVKLTSRMFEWGGGICEFTAIGTAITVANKPELTSDDSLAPQSERQSKTNSAASAFLRKGSVGPLTHVSGQGLVAGHSASLDGGRDNKPFLSNLSGAEFWQLYEAGYWPRALVSGNCSYFVLGDEQSRKAQSGLVGALQNQELDCFSKGISFCRLRAMDRIKKEVKDSRAHGVVGVELDSDIEGVTFAGEPHFARGIIVNFNVLGTSVLALPSSQLPTTRPVMMVIDLAKDTAHLQESLFEAGKRSSG